LERWLHPFGLVVLVELKPGDVAKAFGIIKDCFHSVPQESPVNKLPRTLPEIIFGGVGERLKPPVLKTGVHTVDRGFESRPLRHQKC
jgi:hypothetical protein